MARKNDPNEEESISTDLRSDISFMNRQKELRTLYREFRSAMDDIHEFASEPAPTAPDEEGEEEETENSVPTRSNDEIEVILREIDLMQTETDELVELLSKPKFGKNPRIQSIKKQLIHLQRVNASLKRRAESLLDIE
jgi:hypothetical protein